MKPLKTTLKYGIGIALMLITSFLIFAVLNLHEQPTFSFVNGIIMAGGLYYYLVKNSNSKMDVENYASGFTNTFLIGLNATIFFTAFFVIYGSLIEVDYFNKLANSLHYNLSDTLIIFTVFIMGICTSLVLALTYMQYFKKSNNFNKTTITN